MEMNVFRPNLTTVFEYSSSSSSVSSYAHADCRSEISINIEARQQRQTAHHSDKKNWKVSLRNNSNSVKHILQELPLLEMVAASYHSLIKRKAQLLVTCFTNRNLISTSTWKDSSIKLHKLGERHTNGLKLKWHLRLDLDWWYKIVLFKTQMLLLSYKPNRERTRVHQTDHRQKDQGLG